MAEMQFFSVDQIVWLDKTGCDKRDHMRKFGYAMKGERPVYNHILHRGQRISSVAAMCSDGVIAVEVGGGTYNGDRFLDFIAGTLVPEMLQFDGSNPRSVLVLNGQLFHTPHCSCNVQTQLLYVDYCMYLEFLPKSVGEEN